MVSWPIGAPLAKNATLATGASVSLAVAATVKVAGATALAPSVGLVRPTDGGVLAGVPPLPWKASTSVRRLQPSMVPSMSTRMRVVVTGENVRARFTSVLPRMTPPGTVCHAEPVQVWTVKSVTP